MLLINTSTFNLHEYTDISVHYSGFQCPFLKRNFDDAKHRATYSNLRDVYASSELVPQRKTGTLLNALRTRERRFLPVVIDGVESYALPDTGLNGNAITEDYAMSIGAAIEPAHSNHSFVNARNRRFEPIGVTNLVVSLPDDRSRNQEVSKWTCSFAVVKVLAAPLVLGSQFLRMTETLTSLTHHLVRKTMSVVDDQLLGLKKIWRFMHMDLATQKLGCFLDAEQAFASVDSGSDIDVVSLDYAIYREWQVKPLPDDEGYVMLANNELIKLAGYVETTLGIQGGCISKKFYVLDGLVCDVVLGDPTIEALDLFNQFKESLVDLSTAEDMDSFHMISWVEKIDKMAQEVEKILTGSYEPASCSGLRKTSWKTLFGMDSAEMNSSLYKSAILKQLQEKKESMALCSAEWRRSAKADLLTMIGDEYTRGKEEFDRRKKQNNQIRENIQSAIERLQKSMGYPGHFSAPTATQSGNLSLPP